LTGAAITSDIAARNEAGAMIHSSIIGAWRTRAAARPSLAACLTAILLILGVFLAAALDDR
jgi:hypothetical protein